MNLVRIIFSIVIVVMIAYGWISAIREMKSGKSSFKAEEE